MLFDLQDWSDQRITPLEKGAEWSDGSRVTNTGVTGIDFVFGTKKGLERNSCQGGSNICNSVTFLWFKWISRPLIPQAALISVRCYVKEILIFISCLAEFRPPVCLFNIFITHLAPVVQKMDNAIHRINHYPVDKCWQNKLHYPLDSDLSGG